MKAIERLSVIRYKSKMSKNWKHTEIFRILRKEDIWVIAYENIKNRKDTLIPEITKKPLNNINLKRLRNLREKVVTEKYQFKVLNEIKIPKSDNQKRLLRLSIANDTIIQEVIHIILEAIYEPWFSEQSFGFQQGLGPHDALEYIELKFRWVDWIVKSDMERTYQTINNSQLCKILSDKIHDTKFLNLIFKLLKYEVLCQGKLNQSDFLVPQGSIILLILANIYYNELDEWVQEKKEMVKLTQTNQVNKKYKQFSYQVDKIAKQIKRLEKSSTEYKALVKELKTLKKKRFTSSSLDIKRIQIKYIRYSNDWIISITGDKGLANQLKIEVIDLLERKLKQIVHPTKIKITDLQVRKFNFLGYEIYLLNTRKISYFNVLSTLITRKINSQLKFNIPTNHILRRMEEIGYIKKLVKGYRSISKSSYTTLEDIMIRKCFTQVWRELSNYYSGCTNLQKFHYINYLLHTSCAMTLSHRHQSSTKKTFAKHGRILTGSNEKVKISFPYHKKWSLKTRKWQNKRKFVNPFRFYAN